MITASLKSEKSHIYGMKYCQVNGVIWSYLDLHGVNTYSLPADTCGDIQEP